MKCTVSRKATLARSTSSLLVIALAVTSLASAIIINDRNGHAIFPLAAGQVARIQIANVGDPNIDSPCGVVIHWFAADGSAIGDPNVRTVRPGLTEFADFSDRSIPAGAQRVVRAVVELDRSIPPGPCVVQDEVFDRLTGRTQLIGDPSILPTQ